jgi:catalase
MPLKMHDSRPSSTHPTAFFRLKAIGFSAGAQPLLDKAGVGSDEAVVSIDAGAASFIAQACTRRWDREPEVRILA